MEYYIKIMDNNGNENLPLEISVDDYEYIEYKIDIVKSKVIIMNKS